MLHWLPPDANVPADLPPQLQGEILLPAFSGISLSSTQAVLSVTGMTGPDYTLWSSSNLINWQTLQTSNSPAIPVTFADTNATAIPNRFYRIQIGP